MISRHSRGDKAGFLRHRLHPLFNDRKVFLGQIPRKRSGRKRIRSADRPSTPIYAKLSSWKQIQYRRCEQMSGGMADHFEAVACIGFDRLDRAPRRYQPVPYSDRPLRRSVLRQVHFSASWSGLDRVRDGRRRGDRALILTYLYVYLAHNLVNRQKCRGPHVSKGVTFNPGTSRA